MTSEERAQVEKEEVMDRLLEQEPREPSKANSVQVGGAHYKSAMQHWDWVASNNMDYFQGQITKYVYRWKGKNGLQDLEKAMHFLQKYIELVKSGVVRR